MCSRSCATHEAKTSPALIGPNGCGKTTFLRTILDRVPPLSGQVHLGHGVALSYYEQTQTWIDPEQTVLAAVQEVVPMSEGRARSLLGRFLFSGDDVYKRLGDLSGGERSRVALARLTLTAANLALLDEPTNHLDIPAREALEQVLSEYTVCHILVDVVVGGTDQTHINGDGLGRTHPVDLSALQHSQ